MMKATEDGKGMGRDTTVCGDPKSWFPMRVTYSREMKVKGELDRLGIECFMPMTYRLVETRDHGTTDLRRHGETEKNAVLAASNKDFWIFLPVCGIKVVFLQRNLTAVKFTAIKE